jgi:hypothetical protein
MNDTDILKRLDILFLLVLALQLKPLLHLAQDARRKSRSSDVVTAQDFPDASYSSSLFEDVKFLAGDHRLDQADCATKPVRRSKANRLAVWRRIWLEDHAYSRKNSALWWPSSARCENDQARAVRVHVKRLINSDIDCAHGLGITRDGDSYRLEINRVAGDGRNFPSLFVAIFASQDAQ